MSTMAKRGELTGDYALDTVRTRLGFVARHTMSTRVRGHFDAFEGTAYLDGEHPSQSSIRLTIDAHSIQTRNRQRDDLLVGKFLDAERHPVITFVSSVVEQVDESAFRVTGDLTIRGAAKPVVLDLRLTGTEDDAQHGLRLGFKGGATLNRKDWGVNWNAGTSVMISSKVLLDLAVSVIRQ